MIKYIVSFSFTKGMRDGFGNCDLNMNRKIKDARDLNDVGELIKQKMGYDTVIILFFQEIQEDPHANITSNVDRNKDMEYLKTLIEKELHHLMGE